MMNKAMTEQTNLKENSTNTPERYGLSRTVKILLLIGVLLLSLSISGCASTTLTGNVQTVEIPTPTPSLKVDPSLMIVLPLSPRPKVIDNNSLADWAEIAEADLTRDRGQLMELVGAEKQREYSQEQIDDAALEAAEIKRKAASEAAKQEVKVKKSFWKTIKSAF